MWPGQWESDIRILKKYGQGITFTWTKPVWKDEKYRRLQGTYPTVLLSFAGIKENTFPEARKSICRVIEEMARILFT